MPSWDDFIEWALEQAGNPAGRKALRRRWTSLRALAEEVKARISADEVRHLLGKDFDELDPEQNDLKAIVAYAVGRGILTDAAKLHLALSEDSRADPLFFLAHHSGKTFGEKYAPLFAKFWLVTDSDGWIKKKSKDLFDVGWSPHELKGREIRIELKASSEHPVYLFQQIRHPRMSGLNNSDYDLLLCVGVSAGSLEWWAIPAAGLDRLAENGTTASERAVITRHHGKRRPIWNEQVGYADEGWFRAAPNVRELLQEFGCDASERLRAQILAMFPPTRPGSVR